MEGGGDSGTYRSRRGAWWSPEGREGEGGARRLIRASLAEVFLLCNGSGWHPSRTPPTSLALGVGCLQTLELAGRRMGGGVKKTWVRGTKNEGLFRTTLSKDS